MTRLAYLFLLLTLPAVAQIDYDGFSPDDVSRDLNIMSGSYGFGNECGVEFYMVSNVYEGIEFNGHVLNVRYMSLDVYGSLKNFGEKISLLEAYQLGLITSECNETEITVHETTLSAPAVVSQDVKMFPNPASDRVNILGKNIKSITIRDLSGKTLINISNPQELNIFSVSELASGVYLVTINETTKKLIKK